MPELTPLDNNRQEHFLNGEDLEPITRREHFYAGRESELPAGHQEPETREEWFIQKYRGGGGDVTVVPLSVTENGTYSEEGKAYSPVSVNVPLPQNAYLLKSVNTPTPIASFSDGEDMFMPTLKVAIEPQQEGSGDPSPTNIRPISGWDEVDVTVADDVENPTVSNIYTIDLDGTRYGGEVDVVSGELVVDRVGVDLGSLSWSGSVENEHFYASLNSLPYDKSRGNEIICSCYKNDGGVTTAPYYGGNGTFRWWASPTLAWEIYIDDETGYASFDAFKTAISGQILCYPLATPLTIQLTPTQVKSLLGANNIWADTGDIKDAEYFSKEV